MNHIHLIGNLSLDRRHRKRLLPRIELPQVGAAHPADEPELPRLQPQSECLGEGRYFLPVRYHKAHPETADRPKLLHDVQKVVAGLYLHQGKRHACI